MNFNPFELINERLKSIENSILDLKHQPKESQPLEDYQKLLTVQETAKFLDLAIATIYTKCSKGELPFMKRSKRLYFSRTELLNYLKEGRRKSKSEIEKEGDCHLSNIKKGLK